MAQLYYFAVSINGMLQPVRHVKLAVPSMTCVLNPAPFASPRLLVFSYAAVRSQLLARFSCGFLFNAPDTKRAPSFGWPRACRRRKQRDCWKPRAGSWVKLANLQTLPLNLRRLQLVSIFPFLAIWVWVKTKPLGDRRFLVLGSIYQGPILGTYFGPTAIF